MSSTEQSDSFEMDYTDPLSRPLHRSKGRADNSEPDLAENPDINELTGVRQSFSANTTDLRSHLGAPDDLDTGCSVSVCQMGTTNLVGQPTEAQDRSRPVMVTEALISFVRAVHTKYQDSDNLTEASDNMVIIHTSGNIKTTSSGTMDLPKHVSMSGQEISVAGDPVCIQKMCARVTELDLMENNLCSWDEVFNIIVCIPHLTFLNLTNNRLASDLPSLTSVMSQPLPCLTHLVLNNTGVTWHTLGGLLVLFPSLVELHLGLNNYHRFGLDVASSSSSSPAQPASPSAPTEKAPRLAAAAGGEAECVELAKNDTAAQNGSSPKLPNDITAAVSPIMLETRAVSSSTTTVKEEVDKPASTCPPAAPSPPGSYPSLRRLFFASNAITDWREISRLGRYFPGLEYLLLSETDIAELGDPENMAQCFPQLKALGLGRTQLASWAEVEKLAYLPLLSDVRLSGIPFLEGFPKDMRFQHTVALLPNIHTLNGSRVGPTEREDAERAFLRCYMDADLKPSRYYALECQYGRLDPLAQVELRPRRTVRLKVRVEDDNEKIVKQEEMEVELDQTVRALRKLLSNMTGRSAMKLSLFYMDNQGNSGLDRLIYMDRKLYSYNMSDGDEIVVAFKD